MYNDLKYQNTIYSVKNYNAIKPEWKCNSPEKGEWREELLTSLAVRPTPFCSRKGSPVREEPLWGPFNVSRNASFHLRENRMTGCVAALCRGPGEVNLVYERTFRVPSAFSPSFGKWKQQGGIRSFVRSWSERNFT